MQTLKPLRLFLGTLVACVVMESVLVSEAKSEEIVPLEGSTEKARAAGPDRASNRHLVDAEAPLWFVNVGTGIGSVVYDNYYRTISNFHSYQNGASFAFGFDLGIYHSFMMPNSMLGFSAHGVMDVNPGSNRVSFLPGQSSPYILQTNFAASGIQFLGDSPASGFYIRADIGYSYIAVSSGMPNTGLYNGLSGLGLLGGGGYGIELGKSARLLLGGRVTTILFLPDSPLTGFQGDVSLMFAF